MDGDKGKKESALLDDKRTYNLKLTGKDIEIILQALGSYQTNIQATRAGSPIEITVNHIYRGLGVRL